MANRGLVILVSFLTISFHKKMLFRFSPPRLSLVSLDILLGIVTLSMILFAFKKISMALELNALVITLSPIFLLINAFTAQKNAPPGLMTLKLIYSLFTLALFAWVLTFVGLWQGYTYAQWGLITYGLASGVVMGSFLHSLSRHLITDAQHATSLNLQLEERNRLEQAQNQSLMKFIDMLTHETKNAMAVIN
jgi:hypothetical protein